MGLKRLDLSVDGELGSCHDADALIELAQQSETWIRRTTRFGVKYVVRGSVITPVGREVWLTTVWFIDNGRVIPRLITAYPSEGPVDDSQRT